MLIFRQSAAIKTAPKLVVNIGFPNVSAGRQIKSERSAGLAKVRRVIIR